MLLCPPAWSGNCASKQKYYYYYYYYLLTLPWNKSDGTYFFSFESLASRSRLASPPVCVCIDGKLIEISRIF